MADAKAFEKKRCYKCASAIYSVAIEHIPTIESVWEKTAQFEYIHGSPDRCIKVLEEAVLH